MFNQVQQMFGHLMESKLQYHEPERFWSVFRLWGQTINVREQQDAFDFFQAFTDQIDEHMKVGLVGGCSFPCVRAVRQRRLRVRRALNLN